MRIIDIPFGATDLERIARMRPRARASSWSIDG
jgi:hypothetical protein